jgi:hypothetical protein
MNSGLVRTFGAIAVALLSGCTSSRYYDARYLDAPVETEVRSDSVAGSQVRALATVLGIARPDTQSGRPKQVEMRMRFENLGKVPAQFVADNLSLVSADLVQFGPAQVTPHEDLSIPAGETRQFDLAFPAPDQELDWSGLNLRFTLKFQDVAVTVGVPFRRVEYPIYNYYYPYYASFGFRYGYCW